MPVLIATESKLEVAMTKKRLLLLLIGFCFLIGCATSQKRTEDKFKEISLGMSKKEVLAALGKPTVAKGAMRNKYAQIIEVWEYTLALRADESEGAMVGKTALTVIKASASALGVKWVRKDYWLYFYDNTLVRWGEVGDWGQEIDIIYEYKFDKPELLK
jgi:hypothetical protein